MQTISDLTKDIAKKRQDKERSILEQDERYETALERKTSLVDKREQRNREYYKGKSTGNSARIDGHTQRLYRKKYR